MLTDSTAILLSGRELEMTPVVSKRTETFNALSGPQKRGDATEAIVKAEFLLRDIPVLTPENDNEPYDIVIDVGGTFYKVQCKTGYGNTPGTVKFETRSTRVKSSGYERESYNGKVDLFAVYNSTLDEIYLVDVEEAAKGQMTIRWIEPRNNQAERINWHADFLLDARLEGL